MTGPQFGLTLVLNVEQSDYMTGGQSKTVSECYLQKFRKGDKPRVYNASDIPPLRLVPESWCRT